MRAAVGSFLTWGEGALLDWAGAGHLQQAFGKLPWLTAYNRAQGVCSVGAEVHPCTRASTHIPDATSAHHRPTKCQAPQMRWTPPAGGRYHPHCQLGKLRPEKRRGGLCTGGGVSQAGEPELRSGMGGWQPGAGHPLPSPVAQMWGGGGDPPRASGGLQLFWLFMARVTTSCFR